MSNTRSGTITTDRAARYATQLAGHWARKGGVGEQDGATVIRFETGQVVDLRPEDAHLAITVSVPEGMDADRFAAVVVEPLQRFGQRDELEIVWDHDFTS